MGGGEGVVVEAVVVGVSLGLVIIVIGMGVGGCVEGKGSKEGGDTVGRFWVRRSRCR